MVNIYSHVYAYIYCLQNLKKKKRKKTQNAKYSISLQKDIVWNKLKQGTIFW